MSSWFNSSKCCNTSVNSLVKYYQYIFSCLSRAVGLCSVPCVQVKVMTDLELLAVACEQFLGKSVMETKSVVLQTLEGHLRAILGNLCVLNLFDSHPQQRIYPDKLIILHHL